MKKRVDDDTRMILIAVEECSIAHTEGRWFTLEHPGNSIARLFPEWQALEPMDGIMVIELHSCMFAPSDRRKYDIVVTNMYSLSHHVGKTCTDAKVCSRTGEPHRPWESQVQGGRVVEFSTKGSAQFPEVLCQALAKGYSNTISGRDLTYKWLFRPRAV